METPDKPDPVATPNGAALSVSALRAAAEKLSESDFDHHSGEQLGPYSGGDCGVCDVAADLAFDAAREDAAFGGTKGRD